MDDYSIVRDEYVYSKLKEEAFKNIREIQKPETSHPVKEGESNPERDEQARREGTRGRGRTTQRLSGGRPASRHLHCPLHGCDMETISLETIVIDYCPRCYGIWLDFGELERLFAKDLEQNRLFKERLTKHFDTDKEKHAIKNCPLCREPMEKKKHYSADLFVDVCPDCGGIWLDSGEFAELYLANRRESSIQTILAGVIGNYIDITV
ncbi:MAG: zf-TFIIB domain-containing protein [Spirochaetia bacterium]